MKKTWILVAHRSGARLFENDGPGKGLRAVREIANPEGRLKTHDITSDRPGRTSDSQGTHHSYGKELHDPKEHLAQQFARQLAGVLNDGRNQHCYDQLVLVADPRFLGELREALDQATAALVTATLNKDLVNVDDHDILQHLSDVIRL
ncbi:MAG: host attachment protein [Gammaproteobacteria bacterium]|nr:host attachment protein [Gammaproteobacteria bacterium]